MTGISSFTGWLLPKDVERSTAATVARSESAGAPQADTYTGCLHLQATLTYREDLEDGDGEYERTG